LLAIAEAAVYSFVMLLPEEAENYRHNKKVIWDVTGRPRYRPARENAMAV
jgi:hypothetical protein